MYKSYQENSSKALERYLADVAPYATQKVEEEQPQAAEVTVLAIRAFNGIVTMCQEELSESDQEHLEHVLLMMCHIDVNASGEVLCGQINGFIAHYIEFYRPLSEGEDPYSAISEENLIKLIRLKHYGEKLRDYLKSFITQHKKRKWYQIAVSASKYRWAEDQLGEIETALATIKHRIEHDSDKMIQKIVDNFYIIYICLLALVKYSKLKQDLILELSVNAQIDRILYIIDPSFQAHTLKNKYLLYYHVVYELKELHSSVLSDM